MVRVAGFLSISGAVFSNLCHCNLYPVRGRKLFFIAHHASFMICNLYPVRGRKHRQSTEKVRGKSCNLYPVRGRKLFRLYRRSTTGHCNLYPVRGRKHHSSHSGHNSTDGIAIHPRKGAKKAPPPLEHSSCGGVFCPGQFIRARGFTASLSPESLRLRPGPSASWGRSPPDGPPHPEGSAGCSPHPAAECARFAFGTYCRWRG